MKQMRLFLSFLFLVLLFVPVNAQGIDTKFYYRLTSGSQNERSLTMLGSGSDDNQPVLVQKLQSPGQLWKITDLGNGFVRLTNGLEKEKSLDIVSDGVDNKKLVLNKTADVSGQQWKLTLFGEGFGDDCFRLTNRWQDGKSLEATTDLQVDKKLVVNKSEKILGQMWVLSKSEIAVEEKFELKSTAFVNGAKIPVKYTGEGDDISPPLAWKGAPSGTKSFMIICTDPDAPSPTNPAANPYIHWFVLNIPANTKNLVAGVPRLEQLTSPLGARQAANSDGITGYSGPMPPKGSGRHRYFFTIFAMDRVHVLDPKLTPEEFIKILDSSVLAKAELMGTYEVPGSSVASRTPFRAVVDEIVRLSNIERVNIGVPPLEVDSRLESAATSHSEEMARLDYFSHTSPTPGRETPAERIAQSGFVARTTAENIASFTSHPEASPAQVAVKLWMDSPVHRRNLLNPNYTHIGIGVSLKNQEYFLTQKFALKSSVLARAELMSTYVVPASSIQVNRFVWQNGWLIFGKS